MALDPHEILQAGTVLEDAAPAPLAGTRSQRMQRLQAGLIGLGAIVLMVGLANIIISSAQQNQAALPVELPPATADDVPPPAPRDPLADAGVAPDLPVEAEATGQPAAMPAPADNAGGAPGIPIQ